MCYQPAKMATSEDLALKRRAFEEYCDTTHWPAAGVCLVKEGDRDRKDFRWQRTRNRVRTHTKHDCEGLLQANSPTKTVHAAQYMAVFSLRQNEHGHVARHVNAASVWSLHVRKCDPIGEPITCVGGGCGNAASRWSRGLPPEGGQDVALSA